METKIMGTKSTEQDSQLDEFRRAARELEADESDDALDRAFDRLKPDKSQDKEEPEKPAT